MNQIEAYFIGDLIRKTKDPFEKAKVTLLFHFVLFFNLVFLIPIVWDIAYNLNKVLIVHTFDLLILLTIPFVIKYNKDFRKSLNLFFAAAGFASVITNMCLNPLTFPPVSITWAFLLVSLGALMLNGWGRLFFVGFYLWLPIIYIFLNRELGGALLLDIIVENEAPEAPLFLVILPIILMIYALYVNSKTINNAQVLIRQQKVDIDLKNKDITDSIVYSKRIQNAILAKQEDIKSQLSNSFIIYRPKDIVSGDFYFFEHKDSSFYIAAADCTGHGVPGAFMSLIGIKELSIAQSQSESTGDILIRLNNQIKNTLKQNEIDSTLDGMDIGLIKLEGNQITYSGANRPLWIVRSNNLAIEELRGTRTAIGGNTMNNQVFEEHQVNLSKGDCIYLFTDGYADQFGGDKGKRLTTKRIKNLLQTFHTKTIDEQKNELIHFFEKWKGELEQVDDVLVIGIKI
jgi:serine phosphatase RsbU (regulator of sigma subunit)